MEKDCRGCGACRAAGNGDDGGNDLDRLVACLLGAAPAGDGNGSLSMDILESCLSADELRVYHRAAAIAALVERPGPTDDDVMLAIGHLAAFLEAGKG